jgi:hypothetical protein
LTKEILKLGFWDSKQLVAKKMKRLKTKKEKQNALKSQYLFGSIFFIYTDLSKLSI